MATQTVTNRLRYCEQCGTAYEPYSRRQAAQRFCGDSCRSASFRGVQTRLDFTPAASQLAHVIRGRETKAQRILARLKEGPATSIELARITHRFSARILELRRTHKISREDHVHGGQEWSTYTLEGE